MKIKWKFKVGQVVKDADDCYYKIEKRLSDAGEPAYMLGQGHDAHNYDSATESWLHPLTKRERGE